MVDLIALEEFKEHARITFDDEDDDIERKINAANSHILGYLPSPLADGWEPPEDLRQAAFMIVAHWWENRESTSGAPLLQVPTGANDIIANYRDWVF